MAEPTETQRTLANEARKAEKRIKIATLKGRMAATASVMQILNSLNNDDSVQMGGLQDELASLEAGGGPGITSDYGAKSIVTQLVEKERFAAKAAVVAYVKANPDCTEEDAAAQWAIAALASHPEFPHVLQDGLVMSALYRRNLLAAGFLRDDSWEAHRAWILVTPADTINSL